MSLQNSGRNAVPQKNSNPGRAMQTQPDLHYGDVSDVCVSKTPVLSNVVWRPGPHHPRERIGSETLRQIELVLTCAPRQDEVQQQLEQEGDQLPDRPLQTDQNLVQNPLKKHALLLECI